MLYQAEGIVIKNFDYGEGNIILTIYTREFGKISVMARGAKKAKNRYSAVTQLFTHGYFTYYKSGQMGTLNHGELIASHHLLREQLHLVAYSSYYAELIERTVTDHEPDGFLFEQLRLALASLEEGKDYLIVTTIFEMKILELAGYAPELEVCVSCGEIGSSLLSEGQAVLFSVNLGGVICRNCSARAYAGAIQITEGTLKLLRLFLKMDFKRLGAINVKESTKLELKKCMRELFDAHLNIKWKSRAFIDQMDKYNM